jgi:uncharacterized protein (TIGR03435 family)
VAGKPDWSKDAQEIHRMARMIASLTLFLFNTCLALTQPAATPLAFDAASVKVDAGSEGMARGRQIVTPSPNGISMINVPLKAVIQWAYHLQPVQITGPGWLDADRYDVVAKAAAAAPEEQLQQMMQTLLAQRFKLAVHRETKEMQAYVVTVAKTGLKIKESAASEGDMTIQPSGEAAATIQRATVSHLADMLSVPLQAPVIDMTGLTGHYDFRIDLSSFLVNLDRDHPMGINDVIPIFIKAAQQQLGVKIDQKKMPVEMLVVDHAEKVPVEN